MNSESGINQNKEKSVRKQNIAELLKILTVD